MFERALTIVAVALLMDSGFCHACFRMTMWKPVMGRARRSSCDTARHDTICCLLFGFALFIQMGNPPCVTSLRSLLAVAAGVLLLRFLGSAVYAKRAVR